MPKCAKLLYGARIGFAEPVQFDVSFQNPGEAFLHVLAGRPEVHCPRHVSRPIFVLAARVHQIHLLGGDLPVRCFRWSSRRQKSVFNQHLTN